MPKISEALASALVVGKPCILVIDEGVGKLPAIHQIGGRNNGMGQPVNEVRMLSVIEEVARVLHGVRNVKAAFNG